MQFNLSSHYQLQAVLLCAVLLLACMMHCDKHRCVAPMNTTNSIHHVVRQYMLHKAPVRIYVYTCAYCGCGRPDGLIVDETTTNCSASSDETTTGRSTV